MTVPRHCIEALERITRVEDHVTHTAESLSRIEASVDAILARLGSIETSAAVTKTKLGIMFGVASLMGGGVVSMLFAWLKH